MRGQDPRPPRGKSTRTGIKLRGGGVNSVLMITYHESLFLDCFCSSLY